MHQRVMAERRAAAHQKLGTALRSLCNNLEVEPMELEFRGPDYQLNQLNELEAMATQVDRIRRALLKSKRDGRFTAANDAEDEDDDGEQDEGETQEPAAPVLVPDPAKVSESKESDGDEDDDPASERAEAGNPLPGPKG